MTTNARMWQIAKVVGCCYLALLVVWNAWRVIPSDWASIEVSRHVVPAKTIACVSQSDAADALQMARARDHNAWTSLLGRQVDAGLCEFFEEDAIVYVMAHSSADGVSRVRKSGSAGSLWVPTIMLSRSSQK